MTAKGITTLKVEGLDVGCKISGQIILLPDPEKKLKVE